MPVYVFERDRKRRPERFEVSLNLREYQIYEIMEKTIQEHKISDWSWDNPAPEGSLCRIVEAEISSLGISEAEFQNTCRRFELEGIIYGPDLKGFVALSRRIYTPVGIIFKGPGFYSSDNRAGRKSEEIKNEGEGADSS